MTAGERGGDAFFIGGTDTSVGKTLVCSLLLGFFLEKGLKAGCQKWVSTGSRNPDDLLYCLRNNDLSEGTTAVNTMAPYRFSLAASPHLAAENEGRSIDPEVIKTSLSQAGSDHDVLLVEGVGGLCVPLRRDLLLVDLVAAFGLPVLLVARSGLGTLNHTLLSVEALKKRELPLLGIILSDDLHYEADDLLVNDNMKTIGELTGAPVLGRLPRCAGYREAVDAFKPIGVKLESVLKARASGNG